MPRLSEYIEKDTGACATLIQHAGEHAAAIRPLAAPDSNDSKASAAAEEAARLRQLHSRRLRDHGSRQYRQPDGSLAPHPPPPHPFTVANRSRWSGLVKHCRQRPGTDTQLEQTGISTRYGVGVTYAQHAAALEAVGLTPEYDESGHWCGWDASQQDPLGGAAAAAHPLADDDWRELTRAVFTRAINVHGADIVTKNKWQDLLEVVSEW